MAGSPLRIVFLGNDPWSVPPLRALAGSDHEVALVVTNEPRPAGRGARLRPTAVADAARADGLAVHETASLRGDAERALLENARPDVLVVVAYGALLSPAVLVTAPHGAVNLHLSLLPALRGASPVQAALLAGLHETGVTTIRMDDGLDTGPILQQLAEPIRDDDDAGSLGARLAELGAVLLVGTLDLIATGEARPVPQDDAAATWAPKLGAADRVIAWERPATETLALVRALSPRPGATTLLNGQRLKVLRAEVVEATGPPGAVVEVTDDGPVIGTGAGGIRPLLVAPAGRKRMSGGDLVRGLRLRPGDVLG